MKSSFVKLLMFLLFCTQFPLKGYEYNISLVGIFQNEASYLKEWIEYHHMIGVEHFYLYDDTSTDNWQEVLKPYIEQGLVEVTDWSEPRRRGIKWNKPQIDCYKHALNKIRGVSRWVALLDLDEFILTTADRSLTDCLKNHFSQASGIYMTWRHFGTGGVFLKPGEPILFQLTACSMRSHCRNSVGKSIIRPEDIQIDQIWFAHHFPPKPGKLYMDGDANLIPFVGNDMSNAAHHDKYIRLHHYFTRDENWLEQVKLGRKLRRGWEEAEIRKQNREFSVIKDFKIKNFIKKNYPEKSKEIWGE